MRTLDVEVGSILVEDSNVVEEGSILVLDGKAVGKDRSMDFYRSSSLLKQS